MALSKTNKQLDNTLRKFNKRLTDGVDNYGFATEYGQEMAAAMLQSAIAITNDLRKKGLNVGILRPGETKQPGVTYIMEIRENRGAYDIVEKPMFLRSDILNQVTPAVMQTAIRTIESVGTMGTRVKAVKQYLKQQGITPTKTEVQKELIRRYNSGKYLIQKMFEIYDEAYNDPTHFLYVWIHRMFRLTQANGCQYYEDEINETYDKFRFNHEGLPF